MSEPTGPSFDEALVGWRALPLDERVPAFQRLERGFAGEFFLRLHTDEQTDLILALPAQEQRLWLRLLAPDDAADLIQLADDERRAGLIALLDPRSRTQVEALLAYRADVAGGRMTPAYAHVPPTMTVEQALTYMRLQASGDVSLIVSRNSERVPVMLVRSAPDPD